MGVLGRDSRRATDSELVTKALASSSMQVGRSYEAVLLYKAAGISAIAGIRTCNLARTSFEEGKLAFNTMSCGF
jgi:hypothetical protein